MRNLHTLSIAFVASCCSIALAGPVVDLVPGAFTDSLSGIMNTEMPELIGSIESNNIHPFSIFDFSKKTPELLFEGSFQVLVARSFETGDLHFNYRIHSTNAQLAGMISHIDITGFAGLQTRVEFRNELSAPGVEGPSSASRSADGDILTFDFNGLLDTADDSKWFFAMLDTDTFMLPFGDKRGLSGAFATIYLLSGQSVTLNIAAPIVPSQGPIALLSMAGLITMRRRR